MSRAPSRLAAVLLASLLPATLARAQGGGGPEPDIVVTPTRTPEPAQTDRQRLHGHPARGDREGERPRRRRSLPPRSGRDAHPERRPGPRPDRAHPRRRRAAHPGHDRRHPCQRPDLDRARVRLLDARPCRCRAHRGAARAAKRALRLRRHGRRHQHHHQARQGPADRLPLGRGRTLRHQGGARRHLRRRRAGRLLLRLRGLRHGRLLDLRVPHPPAALRGTLGARARQRQALRGQRPRRHQRHGRAQGGARRQHELQPSPVRRLLRSPLLALPRYALARRELALERLWPRDRRHRTAAQHRDGLREPHRPHEPERQLRRFRRVLRKCLLPGRRGCDLPAGHLLHRRPQGRRVSGRPQARSLRALHLRRQGRAGAGRQLLADPVARAGPAPARHRGGADDALRLRPAPDHAVRPPASHPRRAHRRRARRRAVRDLAHDRRLRPARDRHQAARQRRNRAPRRPRFSSSTARISAPRRCSPSTISASTPVSTSSSSTTG